MKINIEFDCYSKANFEEVLNEFKRLREEHIRATMCKNPDRCDRISNLWWLIHQLENIEHQMDKENLKREWSYQEVKEDDKGN